MIFFIDNNFLICYSIFTKKGGFFMNLFQKDLSLFHDQIIKNRLEYENVKEEKETKEQEKINLGFEIYEIDSKTTNYKLKKNRRLRCNKKIANLKQKRALMVLVFILGSLGSLGYCIATDLLVSLVTIPVLGSLTILTTKIYNMQLKDLIKERNVISENNTVKELDATIEELVKQSNMKKTLVTNLENEINLLKCNLEKLDTESSEIYQNYKFVSDIYQDALDKMDPNTSDEELEEMINQEHADMMPLMVKKLFNRKNV